MKFFARLVMFSLAAGVSLATVANDVKYCESLYFVKDYKRAFPVCGRAAKQGDVYAQFNLATMYYKGKGTPKNDREAVKRYRLVAEQGVAKAQYNLGVMYENGEGVPENDREAVKWYRLAAEQGLAEAQYNLGVMYATGVGVTQDYQEAYIWFSLAAANGNKDASESRDRTAKYLTVSELQIAQQEAQRRFAEKRQEEEEKRKEEAQLAEKKRKEEERKRPEEEKRKEEERKRQEEEKRKEEERKRQEEARLAEEKRLADEATTNALANLRDLYIGRIIGRIEAYLITPPSARGINNLVVVVRVRLHSDGTLVDLPEVVESSGLPEYDVEATRAVMKAAPLPMPTKEPELMEQFKELILYISPD